jgi:lysophospholipase L1-like esterase
VSTREVDLAHLLPRFGRTGTILLAGAVAMLLAVSVRTLWRIGQAVEMARASEPLQRAPAGVAMRLLIVGDSTAVGTGASSADDSLAGLLAREYPHLLIENRAQDGALLGDVAAQLGGQGQYDMVLVQAGGNDVIRMRSLDAMRRDLDRVAELAGRQARMVVLMPAGNVGNAPFFFPPVSWLMTWRSRQLHREVRETAARHGMTYVNLFQERADDPFVDRSELNARDGLHPSDAGYRVWFDELKAQADLEARLAAARGRS